MIIILTHIKKINNSVNIEIFYSIFLLVVFLTFNSRANTLISIQFTDNKNSSSTPDSFKYKFEPNFKYASVLGLGLTVEDANYYGCVLGFKGWIDAMLQGKLEAKEVTISNIPTINFVFKDDSLFNKLFCIGWNKQCISNINLGWIDNKHDSQKMNSLTNSNIGVGTGSLQCLVDTINYLRIGVQDS